MALPMYSCVSHKTATTLHYNKVWSGFWTASGMPLWTGVNLIRCSFEYSCIVIWLYLLHYEQYLPTHSIQSVKASVQVKYEVMNTVGNVVISFLYYISTDERVNDSTFLS